MEFTLIDYMAAWVDSANKCSVASHALLYTILGVSLAICAGGVYIWRRYIRTKPMVDTEFLTEGDV